MSRTTQSIFRKFFSVAFGAASTVSVDFLPVALATVAGASTVDADALRTRHLVAETQCGSVLAVAFDVTTSIQVAGDSAAEIQALVSKPFWASPSTASLVFAHTSSQFGISITGTTDCFASAGVIRLYLRETGLVAACASQLSVLLPNDKTVLASIDAGSDTIVRIRTLDDITIWTVQVDCRGLVLASWYGANVVFSANISGTSTVVSLVEKEDPEVHVSIQGESSVQVVFGFSLLVTADSYHVPEAIDGLYVNTELVFAIDEVCIPSVDYLYKIGLGIQVVEMDGESLLDAVLDLSKSALVEVASDCAITAELLVANTPQCEIFGSSLVQPVVAYTGALIPLGAIEVNGDATIEAFAGVVIDFTGACTVSAVLEALAPIDDVSIICDTTLLVSYDGGLSVAGASNGDSAVNVSTQASCLTSLQCSGASAVDVFVGVSFHFEAASSANVSCQLFGLVPVGPFPAADSSVSVQTKRLSLIPFSADDTFRPEFAHPLQSLDELAALGAVEVFADCSFVLEKQGGPVTLTIAGDTALAVGTAAAQKTFPQVDGVSLVDATIVSFDYISALAACDSTIAVVCVAGKITQTQADGNSVFIVPSVVGSVRIAAAPGGDSSVNAQVNCLKLVLAAPSGDSLVTVSGRQTLYCNFDSTQGTVPEVTQALLASCLATVSIDGASSLLVERRVAFGILVQTAGSATCDFAVYGGVTGDTVTINCGCTVTALINGTGKQINPAPAGGSDLTTATKRLLLASAAADGSSSINTPTLTGSCPTSGTAAGACDVSAVPTKAIVTSVSIAGGGTTSINSRINIGVAIESTVDVFASDGQTIADSTGQPIAAKTDAFVEINTTATAPMAVAIAGDTSITASLYSLDRTQAAADGASVVVSAFQAFRRLQVASDGVASVLAQPGCRRPISVAADGVSSVAVTVLGFCPIAVAATDSQSVVVVTTSVLESISGMLSATETGDSASATGATKVAAVLGATEASDSFTSTASAIDKSICTSANDTIVTSAGVTIETS